MRLCQLSEHDSRTLHIHPLGIRVGAHKLVDDLVRRLAHMLHHEEAVAAAVSASGLGSIWRTAVGRTRAPLL